LGRLGVIGDEVGADETDIENHRGTWIWRDKCTVKAALDKAAGGKVPAVASGLACGDHHTRVHRAGNHTVRKSNIEAGFAKHRVVVAFEGYLGKLTLGRNRHIRRKGILALNMQTVTRLCSHCRVVKNTLGDIDRCTPGVDDHRCGGCVVRIGCTGNDIGAAHMDHVKERIEVVGVDLADMSRSARETLELGCIRITKADAVFNQALSAGKTATRDVEILKIKYI
jgi:hypothetical protein